MLRQHLEKGLESSIVFLCLGYKILNLFNPGTISYSTNYLKLLTNGGTKLLFTNKFQSTILFKKALN